MNDASYNTAVIFAFASFLVAILTTTPAFWLFRSRNLGATVLTAWIIFLNFQNFLNVVIWPGTQLDQGWDGAGFCDVEVKLQVAAQVALPAALLCVLRALAAVMDTKNTVIMRNKSQRCRQLAVDIILCTIPPALQMVFHHIASPYRYFLAPYSGCIAAVSSDLVSLVVYLPPVLIILIDAFYATLILVRLYRYRVTFQSIIANSNTTTSRFIRLYALCVIFVAGFLPMSIYIFVINIDPTIVPVPGMKGVIATLPDQTGIFWDRWLWLGTGILVFMFFGLGKEATTMYRTGLLAFGFGRIFPALRNDLRNTAGMPAQHGFFAASLSTMHAKARLLFKSRGSTSTSTTMTDSFRSINYPTSPHKTTFLETIGESAHRVHRVDADDAEAALPISPLRPSKMSRVASIFKSRKVPYQGIEAARASDLTFQQSTVQSNISGEQGGRGVEPPHAAGVQVHLEIRQDSETAKTLPASAFGIHR